MSMHTGLSTWFVRSSSVAGIQVEHLETALLSRQSSDELERYVEQRRVEWRSALVSGSLAGIVLLIWFAAFSRT